MRPLIILSSVMLFCILATAESSAQRPNRAALLNAAKAYPNRIWFDDTGKHQTVAKYLHHDRQGVTIMKENKLVLVIPFDRLSDRDHNYVESFGNKQSLTMLSKEKPKGVVAQLSPSKSAFSTVSDRSQFESFFELGELPRSEMPRPQQASLIQEGLRKPLAQKDYQKVLKTLDRLSKGWPTEPTAELADAVVLCSSSGNFSVDEAALLLLLRSDPNSHFDVFEKIVERQDFDLRMIGFQGLAAINDDRSLNLLLQKFESTDRVFIGKLLAEFEDRAEPLLQQQLHHSDADHVLVTVSVLAEVGTRLSIPALTDLAKASDKVAIRQQANTAIKRIEQRSASERE